MPILIEVNKTGSVCGILVKNIIFSNGNSKLLVRNFWLKNIDAHKHPPIQNLDALLFFDLLATNGHRKLTNIERNRIAFTKRQCYVSKSYHRGRAVPSGYDWLWSMTD